MTTLTNNPGGGFGYVVEQDDSSPDFDAIFPEPPATIETAARVLAAKLHAIHEDHRYKTVWMIAQSHVGPYCGPNYTDELAALDTLLSAPGGPEYNGGDTPPI